MHLIFTLVFLICQSAALRNTFRNDKRMAEHLVQSFEIPRSLVKIKEAADRNPLLAARLKVFSWTDCGPAASKVHVQALSLSPDPIYLPGPLYVATNFSVSTYVSSPLKLVLKLWKQIMGEFIEIPCVDNFGSCTYDDVCSMLVLIQSQCPEAVVKMGFDCSCPLKANNYSLPKSEFDIGASVVPSGDYHVMTTLTQNDAAVFCLDMYLSIG